MDSTQNLDVPAHRQIVITGASGFLGKRVAANLFNQGFKVFAMSRGRRPNCTQVGNYRDIPAPPGSTLIHLAECRDIPRYAETTLMAEAQKSLLSDLLAKPFAKIIYASSLTVGRDYGDAVPAYVAYKRAAELNVLKKNGVALRFTNLYGSGGMAENTVLMEVLAQLRSGGSTALNVINSAAYIDLLHVDDAAQAVVQAINAPPAKGHGACYDIASGHPVTGKQLVAEMSNISGQSERLLVSKLNRLNAPLIADTTRAEKCLGWSPEILLKDGLRALLDSKP
jgi:GDP-4-dehydro-6-deoxy-D-mannose reductase